MVSNRFRAYFYYFWLKIVILIQNMFPQSSKMFFQMGSRLYGSIMGTHDPCRGEISTKNAQNVLFLAKIAPNIVRKQLFPTIRFSCDERRGFWRYRHRINYKNVFRDPNFHKIKFLLPSEISGPVEISTWVPNMAKNPDFCTFFDAK